MIVRTVLDQAHPPAFLTTPTGLLRLVGVHTCRLMTSAIASVGHGRYLQYGNEYKSYKLNVIDLKYRRRVNPRHSSEVPDEDGEE